METRANYVAVGIFTLVLLLGAFGFVYWSSGIGGPGETAALRFRIPGSASGLGRGSAVLFNGVKVGDVTRIYIDPDRPSEAIADARIDRLTPVTAETTADIGVVGLTGQASIEMKGVAKGANLMAEAESRDEIAVIVAQPSAFANILQTAQTFLTRADSVLTGLEGFVADVRGPLTASAQNAQRFSEALSRNAENIDAFLASVGTLSETLGNASGQIRSTFEAAEGLLNAIDQTKVATIVGNVEAFTARLETASENIESMMQGVEGAVASAGEFTRGANETLAKVDGIVSGVDAEAVRRSVDNIAAASETARTATADIAKVTERVGARAEDIDQLLTDAGELADRLNQASVRVGGVLAGISTAVTDISQFAQGASGTLGKVDVLVGAVSPEDVQVAIANIRASSTSARTAAEDVAKVTSRLGARSEDIDQIITDAQQLASRLNAASVRVDGVLAKVDSFLGSGEAEGLASEASETLASFREVAANLNTRIDTIAGGLSRFTGQGLQDVQGLVQDTRRAITRIEQAITEFERNPQRILTGGDGVVREYDGRARR